MGSHSLLQGIFPTQGSNPGLPHCRRTLYQLSREKSPRILECVAYPFSRGSSRPKNRTGVSCIEGRFFTNWAIRKHQTNAYLTLNLLNPLVIRSFFSSPQAKPESRYSQGPSSFSSTSACLHLQVRTHFTAASDPSLNLLCILPVCFEWLLFLGTQLDFPLSSIWTHCRIFCSPQQSWWVHYSNQLFILSAFNSGPHIFSLTASWCVTMDELLNLPKTEIPHLWNGESLMYGVAVIKQS